MKRTLREVLNNNNYIVHQTTELKEIGSTKDDFTTPHIGK